MKHILPILTAALALMVTTAFAETYQFDKYVVTTTPYTNQNNNGMGEGSYYTIKFTSDARLYLLDQLNTIYDGKQTETLKAMGITQYGYVDSTGKTHRFSVDNTKNYTSFDGFDYYDDKGKQNYKRTAYDLGGFKAGDEIQIWMTDGTTSIASNTHVDDYSSRYYGRGEDLLNKDMPVAQLYMYNSTGNQVNFGLYVIANEGIESDGPVPVGSPLPGGVQIALIAGLFGLGFWYVRRRKAVVA